MGVLLDLQSNVVISTTKSIRVREWRGDLCWLPYDEFNWDR